MKPNPRAEFITPERCYILETWNDDSDPNVSIVRARVAPPVQTQLHALDDVDERYVVVAGEGEMHVGPDDVVVVPAGTAQSITNGGDVDLVFYCVCSPRFRPEAYRALS